MWTLGANDTYLNLDLSQTIQITGSGTSLVASQFSQLIKTYTDNAAATAALADLTRGRDNWVLSADGQLAVNFNLVSFLAVANDGGGWVVATPGPTPAVLGTYATDAEANAAVAALIGSRHLA